MKAVSKRRNKVAVETALVAVNIASLGTVGAIAGALKSLYDFKQMHHEEKLAQKQEQLTVEERQQQAIAQHLEILMDFFDSLFNAKLGKATLPVILVLDDAQWIDADSTRFMAELLVKAARQQWPLFVLATHWEQEWNISDSAHAPDKIPAMYQQLATRYPQICSLRDIDRLDGLDHIVKTAFPGLTDEQIYFLCERADGNPCLLHEIVLELIGEPYYFEQQNQQLALTLDALTEMRKKSFALHDVQERRFRNMNQALQSLLSYASYQGMRFIKDMVLELDTVLDSHQTPDSTEQTFASAIRPYATIFESSAVLYEFRHRVFYDLAKARIDKFPSLEKTIADALTSIGSQWYQNRKHDALTLDERESFYLLMLKLLASQPADPKLQRDVLMELLVLYHEEGHFAKAVPWLDLLESLVTVQTGQMLSEIPFWRQYSLIGLLKELNRWPLAESLAQELLTNSRNQAEAEPENEERQRELVVIQSLKGDLDLVQDRLPQALENYRSALATFELLIQRYGETAERLRDVLFSQINLSDILTLQDQLGEALSLCRASLKTSEDLIQNYGETSERLRDLSISQDNVGRILARQDQLAEALTLYRASLKTRELLVERYGETADLLRGVSVSQNNVGRILAQQDQLAEALKLYHASLKIREQLIERYGETAQRLRDLTNSQINVGDILAQQDQLTDALNLYQASLMISEELIDRYGESAKGLRDVFVSQIRVGDILVRQDQLTVVLKLYMASLMTAKVLIQRYGESTQRLRDLSVSQNKVGDILLRQDKLSDAIKHYQDSLMTAEGLIKRYGESAERLRDESVSQIRIGSILVQQEQLTEALKLYQASLKTAEQLIERYGESPKRLQDVAGSQFNVAGILARQDNLAEALKLYQASLKTHELLVERYGETDQRLRDVFVSCYLIATCYANGSKEQAQWLHQALVTNQHRMLAYPQYAPQTIPEQQQVIGFYKEVVEDLGDPYYLAQLAEFERQLELFQQQ